MVEPRSGDELNLLDSALRTVPGTLLSSGLYAVSGVVYALGTTPAAAGRYLFVTLLIGLLVRPVGGVARTLQKRGSERGTDVAAYLGLALLAGAGYVAVLAGVAALLAPALTAGSLLDPALLAPAVAVAATAVLSTVVVSLLGAVGYPGYQSWLSGGEQTIRLTAVLALAGLLPDAAALLWLTAAVRVAVNVPVLAVVGVVPAVPDRDAVARAWSFTQWSVVDQVIDKFTYNMPVYVLGVVAGPVAVGVYEAADRFADFGATVAFALSSPLLSKVSGDWSAGRETYDYLDAMVTGGTGGTFLVFAYVLAAADQVAAVAFPGSVAAFRTTILLVGGINVIRAGWTLLTHALEGVDRPETGVTTKVAGLAVGVPTTVALAPLGAVAGAVGYVAVNVVVAVGVAYYTRVVFGRLPFAPAVAGAFLAGGLAAAPTTLAVVRVAGAAGATDATQATLAAVAATAVYVAVVATVSPPARTVLTRAAELSRRRLAATARVLRP